MKLTENRYEEEKKKPADKICLHQLYCKLEGGSEKGKGGSGEEK